MTPAEIWDEGFIAGRKYTQIRDERNDWGDARHFDIPNPYRGALPVAPDGPATCVIRGREYTIWCQCYGTPEPDGPWIHPDDEHADTCGIDAFQAQREVDGAVQGHEPTEGNDDAGD